MTSKMTTKSESTRLLGHPLRGSAAAIKKARLGWALLPLLALNIWLAPHALSAPTPSLLSQEPMFIDTSAQSNVVFLLDNSQSMGDIQLPAPRGLSLPTSDRVLVDGMDVSTKNEWILRSSALNPQYYNPAITYKPWNYDGKLPAVSGMVNSDINIVVTPGDNFRVGLVRHDMRYTGPNYDRNSRNVTPKSLITGANAITTNSANDQENWFKGATKTLGTQVLNQDIFSRPPSCPVAPVCTSPQVLTKALACPAYLPPGACTATTEKVDVTTSICNSANTIAGTAEFRQEIAPACNGGFLDNWSTTRPAPAACTTSAFADGGKKTAVIQGRVVCPTGYGNTTGGCCPNGDITKTVLSTTFKTTFTFMDCPTKTCPVAEVFGNAGIVRDDQHFVPAHYYRFEGPGTPGPIANLAAAWANPAFYKRVEIDRDNPTATYPTPWQNNDPSLGRVTRTDCGKGTSCTFAEEAQNFANWYTYYRTRIFAAIGVTAESLSQLKAQNRLDSIRLGYGVINYFPRALDLFAADPDATRLPNPLPNLDGQANFGGLLRGVRPFTEGANPDRQQVFEWLFSVRNGGSTPNREAYDSVGRYFTRTDDLGPWADKPGVGGGDPNQLSCRRNYTILVTDGEWTKIANPDPAKPRQPRIEDRGAGPLDGQGGTVGSTPRTALSAVGPRHQAAGIAAGTTYAYDPAAELSLSGGSGGVTNTMSDVTMYYWNHDLRPDLANTLAPAAPGSGFAGNPAFWQHLVPYTIAYGITPSMDFTYNRDQLNTAGQVKKGPGDVNGNPSATATQDWPKVFSSESPVDINIIDDVDPACAFNALTNASGCGRVDDTFRSGYTGHGDFLAATDVKSLAASVAHAFQAINQANGAATSIAGRSAILEAGDSLYTASFITGRWTGSVNAYDALTWYNAALDPALPRPAAQWVSRFPAQPATNRNILTATDRRTGAAFTWNTISAAQQTQLGTAALVDYFRGDQSKEASRGGPYRIRDALLGDIVNSSPLYSKSPDFGYTAARAPAAAGAGGATYAAYVTRRKAAAAAGGRLGAVYVGANDGMFHAFDAETNKGLELFAYVPRGMYAGLPGLASTGYVHNYFVDGPVVEADVYFGGWRTVVVGASGAGPKSLFALDVTDPAAMNNSKVLWDLTGAEGDAADLGHILAPGFIGSGKDGRWYYFVGNGYESTNDKAVLLIIDLQTGTVRSIAAGNTGGNNPAALNPDQRPNGLGGVTPLLDGNQNVVAIYAGDRLGHLWKFDLSAANPVNWRLARTGNRPLFTATDPNGNRQPISAAPSLTPHPLGGWYVTFGTGSFFEAKDRDSTQVQSVYAIWERPGDTRPVDSDKTKLHQFKFTDATAPGSTVVYRQLSDAVTGQHLNFNTDEGWYVNLLVGGNALGERVVAAPIDSLGFVNVTSYEPISKGDICIGGGRSFFYRFDLATNFERLAFDKRGNLDVGINIQPSLARPAMLSKALPTTNASAPSVSAGQLGALIDKGTKYAGTNPCPFPSLQSTKNTGTGTTKLACNVPALRVWRELPRGPR